MGQPRNGLYIWITWLSKLMAGEQACEWSTWFKARTTYTKLPSDFDLAAWTVDHTRQLRELKNERRKLGELVTVEGENAIKYCPRSGVTLAGKPDLIAAKDGNVVIYDVKTGQPKTSDNIQVMLYMHLVPLVVPNYRGTKPSGCIAYNDSRLAIPSTAVNDKFIANVEYFLDAILGEEPPKSAGSAECRFCDIPPSECEKRYSGDLKAAE